MADKKFFRKTGDYSVAQLAEVAGCKLQNCKDENTKIVDITTIDKAGEGEISFLSNPKYLEAFKESKATACIVEEKFVKYAPEGMILLVSDNAYNSYAIMANYVYPMDTFTPAVSAKASISPKAKIGKECYVADFAVIMDNAEIGDNCYIGANTVICEGVKIGNNTHIKHGVVLTHTNVGQHCLIHSGARIGQDGFGFAPHAKGVTKVPQLGRVIIGNNVEIGANTTIDRGAVGDTEIGDFTKIDNLVQIGHNVKIGRFCFIVAQVGIAGSTTVGDKVMMGGQVGIAGHINIANGTMIAAQSGLMLDTEENSKLGGSPAMPLKKWHRMNIMIQRMLDKKSNDGGANGA